MQKCGTRNGNIYMHNRTQNNTPMKHKILALALTLCTAMSTRADVVATFPEVNYSSGTSYPSPMFVVGTDVFGPVSAVSATLSGVFGSTSSYYGSSAEFELYINNILVGSTYDVSPDPYYNVVAFNFALSAAAVSSLNSGSATFGVVQQTNYVIRLSDTTLTIQTSVPEGGSTLAALGLVMCGLVALRRKQLAA